MLNNVPHWVGRFVAMKMPIDFKCAKGWRLIQLSQRDWALALCLKRALLITWYFMCESFPSFNCGPNILIFYWFNQYVANAAEVAYFAIRMRASFWYPIHVLHNIAAFSPPFHILPTKSANKPSAGYQYIQYSGHNNHLRKYSYFVDFMYCQSWTLSAQQIIRHMQSLFASAYTQRATVQPTKMYKQ